MNSVVTKNEKDTTKAEEAIVEENTKTSELDNEDQPEIVTRDIKRRNTTLEVASGAILGSLSV
ncbi:MAG TPA: hypothetical protein VMX17_16605, partial [Candidatus Glassbacteria bacterium]|nr:hypothetical protein [Candidatus Glassbacteria bacterium]